MGLGDELMAAGQARRVYQDDPSKRVSICDHHDRPRWHELWDHNPILATPQQVASGEPVHRIRNAKFCRPYIQYPFTTDTGWHWTDWRARDHVGEVYLTDAELERGYRLREELGAFILIEPSVKPGSTINKNWGLERYAAVVAACRDIRFVRVVHADQRPLPGTLELHGLTFREVIGILTAAHAYVGTEGALHHAAAAVGTPAAVVWGGCASVEALGYPMHLNLVDTGPGSPCGRFWPCDHCRAAMARITVDHVVEATRAVWACEAPHAEELHDD